MQSRAGLARLSIFRELRAELSIDLEDVRIADAVCGKPVEGHVQVIETGAQFAGGVADDFRDVFDWQG